MSKLRRPAPASAGFPALTLPPKAAAWTAAAFTLVYFAYSFISDGFYQDDEIGHFQNMERFWSQPATILGNWAKPGFKILYLLPALAGYKAVLFLNAAITGLMVYLTWRLAREAGIKHDALAPLFCGFQPMLFQLSFRTYSELLTAVLMALLILSVLRDRTYAAAFLGTYLFSIRQELALLAPLVFFWLVYKKAWKAIPVMAIPLLALVWAGWAAYADPFWVFTEAQAKGTDSNFVRQGFWHYFKLSTPVFGSITIALLFPGLAEALRRIKTGASDRWTWTVLLTPAVLYFLTHCVLTSEFADMSASAGNLRYLVVIAPLVAVLAAKGFDVLSDSKPWTSAPWAWAGGAVVLILLFFSYHYNHLLFLPDRDESRWIAAAGFLGLLTLLLKKPTIKPVAAIGLFYLFFAGFTLYNEPPKKNSPENEAVKAVAEWLETENLLDRRVLINHPMFYFYSGRMLKNPMEKYPGLFLSTLEQSAPGTIAIWDSHYSDRPEYKMDVPYTWFDTHPEWKLLRQTTSGDRRYVALIFEKQ